MGNTWAVSVWLKDDFNSTDDKVVYCDHRVYSGENFWVALYHFFKARETGSGCIKLEYRGVNR